MARGGELIIDEQFVKNLIDADKAIRNISDSASNAERSMTSWISKLNSGSLTDFVKGLEETKNKYDLMIGALSRQEGFGKFTQNCKDAADEVQKLINIISQTPQFKLDLYDQQTVQRTKEIEQEARKIQERQLRDNAIAEQKKAHVQEELNRYKLLKKEIEELEKIKRQAKDVKATSTDTELVKDAKKTYTEANRQLKALKEEQKRLETKYAVEIELINKDAAMRSFSSRVKAAKDAEKAVEAEIEKEKKARLQALEQESQAYQRYTERIKELEKQKKSIDDNAKKAVEAEIKREKDAYLKSLEAQIKARQEYNARMEALKREQARRDSNRRRENFNNLAITDPNKFASNAINYTNRIYSDKGVLSINNMQKALSRMQEAQQRLNLNTAEGRKKYNELGQQIKEVEKDIKSATKGVRGFKSESDKLGRIFSQLKTQLTALFGIAAIKGYIQKLVDVRREFERQQIAMEGILQSKDEADKLWSQTTQLALKSPFSVRELITYTKQLSAYRIETDKLHDTTKRLADVSAGLGVDMSRLILAYGQVRAAEYLRGTELRQFTEAGIPMLEELANYFEEVEGRAYTTAEVFNMISKRMVEFEDVEAVIHRMTDEGGIFFEMQEKQSKTLYGEMSNLKDAYELMLNDIGKSQQGVITSFIRNIRYLINSWYDLIPLITSVGFGLTTGVFGAGIIKAIKGFAKLRQQIKLTGASMLTLSKIPTTGWVAIIGLVASLASYLIQVATRIDEVTAAMNALNNEINSELSNSVLEYKKLAREITDVTKSYSEQEKAMSRLKRKFQDILPDQYTEIEYITQMTDGYKEATYALESHYNAKLRRQKEDKLNNIYEAELTKEIDALTKAIMEGSIAKYNKNGNFLQLLSSKVSFGEYFNLEEGHVTQAINSVIERIKEGEVEVQDLRNEIIKTLEKFYDVKFDGLFAFNVKEFVDTITRTLLEYEDQLSKVGGLRFETKQLEDEDKARREANKRLEEEKEIINELSAAYGKYYKAKEKQTKKGTTPELEKAIEGFKGDIKTNYEKLKLDFPVDDFFNITANQHEITNEIEKITKQIYNRFQKQIEEESKTNPLLDNFSEDLANAIEDLDSNKDIKETTEQLFKALSKQFSIPMSMFDKFEAKSDSTIESVRKKMEDELELIKKSLESYYNALDTMPKMLTFEGQEDWLKRTTGLTPERVKELETFVEILTLGIQVLGGAIKKTTNNKSQEDYYKDILKILQDTHKEYKDLTNTLSHVDAKQLALDKHTRAFAEAVKGIPSLAKFKLDDFAFDQEGGAIESLEKLKTLIPTTAKNYKSLMVDIEKAIGDLRGEATIEAKVKADEELIQSIEEMFDGYELSLELEKLGLPKNFMSDLFNIDTFDLDQIRTKIENEISRIKSSEETKQGEKDRLEELEKQLRKVDDMEEKQMQERLKKYSKYLLKSQSEAVKIKLEELRQIEEIESLQNVSSAQKTAMKQGVKDEAQKKLDENTWETFKEGEIYIRLFEDLEYQSVKSLRSMRSELTLMRDNLKKNLDPSALKDISDKIDSLDEQIVKRNPFKALGQAYKDFISVYKRYGSEKELEDKLQQSINDRDSTSALIYNQELQVKQAQKKVDDALLSNDKVRIANAKLSLSIQENTLNTLKERFKNDEDTVKLLDEALSKIQKSRKMFSGGIGEIGGDISAIASSLPTIMGDLESMGIGFSDEMRDAVESISEIGQGVGNAIQGFASGNYLQGIMGVTSALGAIFSISDKSKERRIQREIKLVENLGYQYEKLQKQIDNAYSLDTFRESYAKAQQNLDEQIEATERMIAAEEAKKNTDHERIEEWKRQLEDYEQQKQELLDKQLQELGGFGESGYKDAAQQFVDAWVEAFRETGDGLSALEDKWDEYIQNVIRKQMALKVSDKLVEPLLAELDKALEDDSYLSTDELKKLDELSKDVFPKLNEALQQISDLYGSEWLKTNGELSGLTSGIQGITEQTADQLTGIINSIRLYVANNSSELISIANTLKESFQIENPMLSQLKLIATHTDNINTLLESVVGQYHSGGRGIKVIM